jgi:hypothetical protein
VIFALSPNNTNVISNPRIFREKNTPAKIADAALRHETLQHNVAIRYNIEASEKRTYEKRKHTLTFRLTERLFSSSVVLAARRSPVRARYAPYRDLSTFVSH